MGGNLTYVWLFLYIPYVHMHKPVFAELSVNIDPQFIQIVYLSFRSIYSCIILCYSKDAHTQAQIKHSKISPLKGISGMVAIGKALIFLNMHHKYFQAEEHEFLNQPVYTLLLEQVSMQAHN